MSFWMREASLQIGSKKYSMDNLYFEFEVPFEDSDTCLLYTSPSPRD